MAPKYCGSYKVVNKTLKINFYLGDRTQKQLPIAVTQARLKIAPYFVDKDPHFSVDKIIKDRIRDG